MDLSIIIASGITSLCVVIYFALNGWRSGLLIISALCAFLGIYFLSLKFWGQEGKNISAIIIVVFALAVSFLRKHKK